MYSISPDQLSPSRSSEMEESVGFTWETFSVPSPPSPSSVTRRREWERDICHNLRDLHEPTWGFTIFRTIYSPGSDILFAQFLSKLRAYVEYAIDSDLRPSPFRAAGDETTLDSRPNEEMKRRFANDIVESPDLDGANPDRVRDAFTKWLQARGVDAEIHQLYARHRVCIMVDEEALQSVAAAPTDPNEDHQIENAWVKVVEYLAPGEERWQGWLKVAVEGLYGFWFAVYGDEDVGGMFESMVDDGQDVYIG